MKKWFYSVIVLMYLISFTFILKPLNAAEVFICNDDIVAIRTKTDTSGQGLKFSAFLDDKYQNNEYGFYIVKGEYQAAEITAAINAGFIDGQAIIKIESNNLNNNYFSVAYLNVNEADYFSKFSAISYVIEGINTYFSEKSTCTSIFEIALNYLNKGMKSDSLVDVINKSNYFIFQELGTNDFVLTKSLLENNYQNLQKQFIYDLNNCFGLNWQKLEAEVFFDFVKEDVVENFFESKLYLFFNDSKMKYKWGFILEFFSSLSVNENLNKQIDSLIIKKEGLYNKGLELSYSLYNFFNKDNLLANFGAINFKYSPNYETLSMFNKNIYVDINNYQFYNVGESFSLPVIAEEYFSYFSINRVVYNEEDIITVNQELEISAVYEYEGYVVTFLNEDEEVIDVQLINDDNQNVNLPIMEKNGCEFVGWYDENNQEFSLETNIEKNHILKPLFKKEITEIYINIDKKGYKILNHSENIDVIMKYDYNYVTLEIDAHEGFIFTEDVVIVVVFDETVPSKLINQQKGKYFIKYVVDDPNWSGRY